MGDIAGRVEEYLRSAAEQPREMPFDISASGAYQNGVASGDVRLLWRKLLDRQGRSAVEFSGGASGAYGNAPYRVRQFDPSVNVNYVRRF